MISICIPTYNYDISNLIFRLNELLPILEIEYEIIVMEDGSEYEFSQQNEKKIKDIPNVNHIILPKNIGRSAIRNKLAETSRFNKLIFLDSDIKIDDHNFIKNYLDNIKYPIIYGGTKCDKLQKNDNCSLRYTCETEKIDKNFTRRFTTANFMADKEIFNKVKFREFLTKYGHEDTLFAYELEKNGISVKYIDNPVIHLALDINEIFLEKTEQSIINIFEIEKNANIDKDFLNYIAMLKFYNEHKTIIKIIFPFVNMFNKQIKKYLIKSKNPKLVIFDLYKLIFYTKNKKRAYSIPNL
ncbi:MAG: glycosyltransferase family 2 protein [Bacteroidales bacterium]|jgi:hypothetical protein|nr:glycosyltransferase family 2 protein [Bacteroidales bacterium]